MPSASSYNLKGQPDLLVVLLKPRYRATEIKKEIGYLKQLVKVSGMLSISIILVSMSVSDESLELTQPSFKFPNISPARLDSQLEALGIKTPRRYKKITFIDTSMPKPNVKRHGLVVQKIKGAWVGKALVVF
jgi:hypothetical protein